MLADTASSLRAPQSPTPDSCLRCTIEALAEWSERSPVDEDVVECDVADNVAAAAVVVVVVGATCFESVADSCVAVVVVVQAIECDECWTTDCLEGRLSWWRASGLLAGIGLADMAEEQSDWAAVAG